MALQNKLNSRLTERRSIMEQKTMKDNLRYTFVSIYCSVDDTFLGLCC